MPFPETPDLRIYSEIARLAHIHAPIIEPEPQHKRSERFAELNKISKEYNGVSLDPVEFARDNYRYDELKAGIFEAVFRAVENTDLVLRIGQSNDPRHREENDFFSEMPEDFELPAVYFIFYDPEGSSSSSVGTIPNHFAYQGNEFGAENHYFFDKKGKAVKYEWVGGGGPDVGKIPMQELKTNVVMENVRPRYVPLTPDDEHMITTHLQMVQDGYYR